MPTVQEARRRMLASPMILKIGEAYRDANDAEQSVYKKRQRTAVEERYTARVEVWSEAISIVTGIGVEEVKRYAQKALGETPPRAGGTGFWDEYEATFWSYVG